MSFSHLLSSVNLTFRSFHHALLARFFARTSIFVSPSPRLRLDPPEGRVGCLRVAGLRHESRLIPHAYKGHLEAKIWCHYRPREFVTEVSFARLRVSLRQEVNTVRQGVRFLPSPSAHLLLLLSLPSPSARPSRREGGRWLSVELNRPLDELAVASRE